MLLLSSVGESIFQLIVVLAIFAGVLALTYFVTRWIAGYQKSAQYNKNLEIVETIKLTANKYVQILRAGEDSYYVIALGKDEVTLLGTLSGEQLRDVNSEIDDTSEGLPSLDFKCIMEKVSKKK